MAETRSTYFALPRYSADGDEAVTRTDWEEMITRVEERVAFDDGATADTLPVTLLKPGRYFRQSFADGYALHRRSAAGAWEWVGGTVQATRVRMRSTTPGDTMLSSDTGGVSPTTTATWKASGEIATAAPLRSSSVGAFGAALDADLSVPSATGRALVRTVEDADRALVLAAHGDAAGALLTARTAGGSDPLTIDSRGRLRSSAPAGLGQSSPGDNIPLGIAPSASDLTALDLYARPETTPIPALRIFRAAADADPIMRVLPEQITLGRTTWSGGSISLRAPGIGLTGSVTATGTLGVSEAATFAKGISAEAGKVTSFTSAGTTGLRSSVKSPNGTTLNDRDLRHSLVWRQRYVNLDVVVTASSPTPITTIDITPTTTCFLDLALGVHLKASTPGASGQSVEPVTITMGYRLLSQDGLTMHFGSDQIYDLTLGAYDTWDVAGRGQIIISDICPFQVTAGTTYKIQLFGSRTETVIGTTLRHITGTVREAEMLIPAA